MQQLSVRGIICDMDGVIYHGNALLPGAATYIEWLQRTNIPFLFLTNSSERSPRELSEKLERMGVSINESHFYTSAMATSAFLSSQCPGGSAYVIGQPGLINAIYEAGFSINDVNPDYVVIGETPSYNYESITKAVMLVRNGAKLIGTNPDLTGPVELGIVPACGALVAPIELATGVKAYFVGKPNPIIMRSALRILSCQREFALIVGDRMDTDIIAGIEAGIKTVMVLSGVTQPDDMKRYGYRPDFILSHVGQLPELISYSG
ncbi:MAG: HAD family hydrolase [Lentisphaerae bacterium]|jgi:NagD protein|nr:HAD family hydrolase [Lentisphaerota bacterium]